MKRWLCILAAVGLVGCSRGADAPGKSATSPRSAGAGASAAWSTYHGDTTLAGFSAQQLPGRLTRVWRTKVGAAVSSAPVAGKGMIFALTDAAEVVALDAKGKKVWTHKIEAPPDPAMAGGPATDSFSAPLIFVDGKVVAASDSGYVYALDAAKGTLLWKYEAGEGMQGTPNWAMTKDGQVRIIALTQSEGILHCIDGAGKSVWTGEPVARTDGSPAVGGGRIVFGSCDSAFHVFSVEDGQEKMTIPLGEGSEMAGGIAISGKHAFSGNRSGSIVCVDMVAGEEVWMNDDGDGELFTAPSVTDTHVVFASGDGFVYAADRKSGSQVWAFESEGMMVSDPVIAGDKVLVCADGSISMLSLKDGSKLWAHEVSDDITSPAIAYGLVIVGTDDGHLIALGPGK